MEDVEITLKDGQRVSVRVQRPDKSPKSALLLLHGRGASASNIIRLAENLSMDETVVLAPDAPGHSWYPNRFLVPQTENEPHLSNALETIDAMVALCARDFQIQPERIVLGGFSQGACLSAEYASRSTHRFAGVCVMSGGLIGTDENIRDTPRNTNLDKMPVYIGCDIEDFHIPIERVKDTASLLEHNGAEVTLRIYTDIGHTIHHEAVEFLQSIINNLAR